MTLLTYIALSVSVTALLASIGAWFVTRRLWRLCLSTSAAKLSERLMETEGTVQHISQVLKNMRSAQNMRAHRERKAQQGETSTPNPDEQRAATLRALQPKLGVFPHAK